MCVCVSVSVSVSVIVIVSVIQKPQTMRRPRPDLGSCTTEVWQEVGNEVDLQMCMVLISVLFSFQIDPKVAFPRRAHPKVSKHLSTFG